MFSKKTAFSAKKVRARAFHGLHKINDHKRLALQFSINSVVPLQPPANVAPLGNAGGMRGH